MSAPIRVLLVGNFGRRDNLRSHYGVEHKLATGFLRGGDHVLTFSDRDTAREATILGAKRWGRRRMIAKLVDLVGHYRPALVVFGHCGLLDADAFAAMRDAAPGARFAAIMVDAIFREATMASFRDRLACVDAGFITTGPCPALRALGFPKDRLRFMPNPVDPSIETAAACDVAREALAYDGVFLGTGIHGREAQLAALRAALPPDYRFHDSGRPGRKGERLRSTAFLERLAQGAVGPNLPHDDADPAFQPPLYSSDRIAQLLGMGLTTLTFAPAALETLYEDGVVVYRDRAHLAAEMIALRDDDARRRAIGAVGRRIAHDRTGATRIARYIRAATLERPFPERYEWPTEPIA